MAKRYSRGWMPYRLRFMLKKEYLSTEEVRTVLKVSDGVLRRWLADPYFMAADVAKKKGQWVWHRDRLRLWVIAVVRVKHWSREMTENPPVEEYDENGHVVQLEEFETLTQDEARERLNIPLDYVLRKR
jgi:hypothetical protein